MLKLKQSLLLRNGSPYINYSFLYLPCREATALVSSHTLDISDKGLVVIGVRLSQIQLQDGELG